MAEIIRMPRLSDTMTEGVVAHWHKKVGDKVSSGELLAEIETDKATMEFESFYNGILLHIGLEKGQTAPVDSILAIIGEKGESIKSLLEEEKNKILKSPEPVKATSGQHETTNSVEEIPVQNLKAEKPTEPKPIPLAEHSEKTSPQPLAVTDGRAMASPIAKKLAREKGINLMLLRGTGDGGRIIKRDIQNYLHSSAAGVVPAHKESYSEIPVSQMRKTIAKRLAESKFTAPHFYLTMDMDMDRAVDVRNSINASRQVKISFNDLIVKAVAVALRAHPKVNVSWMGDKLRYHGHIHIGVAVAVEEGLLVPVVRFADGKTLTQINSEVKVFAEKARSKKLQPEEMQGNTFTISNLGMFGIEHFTAIINPPDACILAVGGVRTEPVVKDGEIKPGSRMKVTLSCDHRVVDGATGSAFLVTLKQYLENPVLFLGTQSI